MKKILSLIAILLALPLVGRADIYQTGTLNTPRYGQTTTLLPNGLVLVAGGYVNGDLTSCELYNPATGIWTPTGSMITPRVNQAATLLPNGQVLVAGGLKSDGSNSVANCELYNPATGTWTVTGSLTTAQYGQTLTLLTNGLVLDAAAYAGSAPITNCELYNPTTGTWTDTGSLTYERTYSTSTLLPNGQVLAAGGDVYIGTTCELYNPATGIWTVTGSMSVPRGAQTATLLPNGQVLVTGGAGFTDMAASCELYNPATGTWTATDSMTEGRYGHTATLLTNGLVFVAGGYDTNDGNIYLPVSTCELYNPASGTWTNTAPMTTRRYYQTATLLPNGQVLIAGGDGSGIVYVPISSCELYSSSSPFIYTTNGSAATITGYKGVGGPLPIPSAINGLTVVGIDYSFYTNYLTSLTIPGSVTNIIESGLGGGQLTNLLVVPGNSYYSSVGGVLFDFSQSELIAYPEALNGSYMVPGSVTSIGQRAFNDCEGLTGITISDNVTNIGDFAFYFCAGLTTLTIPDHVTSIGMGSFTYCQYLTSVTTPNSLLSVGMGAFYGCLRITNLVIGNSVTNIELGAFYQCASLKSITIPASVTSIEDIAFEGCVDLTNLTFLGNAPALDDAPDVFVGIPLAIYQAPLVFYVPGTTGWGSTYGGADEMLPTAPLFNFMPQGNSIIITSYTGPGGAAFIPATITGLPVTSIGANAFANSTGVTSINLPNTLTSIGSGSFTSSGLTSLVVPASVTSIGDSAFASASSLTNVFFQGNTPSMSPDAFAGDSHATVYYLPQTSGWSAFAAAANNAPPVVLWNPQAQALTMQGGQVNFTITGTPGIPIVVEAGPSLNGSDWTALQSSTVTNGSIQFSDSQLLNQSSRFYRFRSP